MTLPKSVSGRRLRDLIDAAASHGCLCLSDTQRIHEGKCISCWALEVQVVHEESMLERNMSAEKRERWERHGIKGHSPEVEAYFERRCELLRAEQRLRAEQVARRRQEAHA